MLVELLDGLRAAVFLDVAVRGIDVAAHRQQVALHQAGLARHHHADGHVGLAHAEVEFVVRQHQAHVYVGIGGDELVHLRGQRGRAEAHRRMDF